PRPWSRWAAASSTPSSRSPEASRPRARRRASATRNLRRGSWGRRSNTGSRKQEAGNRKQETENRRQETGNSNAETGYIELVQRGDRMTKRLSRRQFLGAAAAVAAP